MKPTMNFVVAVSGDILTASAPLDRALIFQIVGEAIKTLPKSPVSIGTVRFIDDGLNCLAMLFDEFYVGYSIRDEVVKIIVVRQQ